MQPKIGAERNIPRSHQHRKIFVKMFARKSGIVAVRNVQGDFFVSCNDNGTNFQPKVSQYIKTYAFEFRTGNS